MSSTIPVRIMPVGGSITWGVGSSTGNGYREWLQKILAAKGYDIIFVGSRQSGSMQNNHHEGWRGYRLDQIKTKTMRSADVLCPDLFAINAGSNDCVQDFQVDCFGQRMDNLLECCWLRCPISTVMLSTLLVATDKQVNARVLRVNEQIRHLVKLKLTQGKRILLADMSGTGGPGLGDLVDGIHPNDEGYEKMAVIWAATLQAAINKRGYGAQ